MPFQNDKYSCAILTNENFLIGLLYQHRTTHRRKHSWNSCKYEYNIHISWCLKIKLWCWISASFPIAEYYITDWDQSFNIIYCFSIRHLIAASIQTYGFHSETTVRVAVRIHGWLLVVIFVIIAWILELDIYILVIDSCLFHFLSRNSKER